MRHPNQFQLIFVMAGALIGGALGWISRIDIGHSGLIVLLGALAGAFVGLLISGTIVMVTNYWKNKRDE